MVTNTTKKKVNRKDDILRALAIMLESNPGQRITTAKLAAQVGVSEAALYRHFPSKARMFEGLIDFIESEYLPKLTLLKIKKNKPFHVLNMFYISY